MTQSRLAEAVERAEQRDAVEVETAAFGATNQEQILKLIGLDPRDPKAHAVVAVARRYALDPVLGHIAIIPRSNMPYITRDGYLHIAHRSGQLDGIEVMDGPRREGSEWAVSVAVYRRDMQHAFVYPGRASVANDNGPEMCIARAERRALKRAFAVTLPADFGEADGEVAGPVAAQWHSDRLASTETDENPSASTLGTPNREIQSEAREDEVSEKQRAAIFAQCTRLGIADSEQRQQRLDLFGGIVGRDVTSTKDLNRYEASLLISTLTDLDTVNLPEGEA